MAPRIHDRNPHHPSLHNHYRSDEDLAELHGSVLFKDVLELRKSVADGWQRVYKRILRKMPHVFPPEVFRCDTPATDATPRRTIDRRMLNSERVTPPPHTHTGPHPPDLTAPHLAQLHPDLPAPWRSGGPTIFGNRGAFSFTAKCSRFRRLDGVQPRHA